MNGSSRDGRAPLPPMNVAHYAQFTRLRKRPDVSAPQNAGATCLMWLPLRALH